MLDLSEECTTKVISATDWCESADDWDKYDRHTVIRVVIDFHDSMFQ